MEENFKIIFAKIDKIIDLVESSNLNKLFKYFFLRDLLSLKLLILDLKKEYYKNNKNSPLIKLEKKVKNYKKNSPKLKENKILDLIKAKRKIEFREIMGFLQIPERTLRRYIRNLKYQQKIKLKKIGRKYFYITDSNQTQNKIENNTE